MRRGSLALFSKKNLVQADQRSGSIATPTLYPIPSPSIDPVEPGFRILDLPLELQSSILCQLSHVDILNLRRSSRLFLRLVQTNQHTIIRGLWRARFPTGPLPCLCTSKHDFVSALNIPSQPTFDEYFRFLHRDRVVARLADTVTIFVESKILRLHIQTGLDPLTTMRWNLIFRLRLALLHWHEYWQEYRRLLEAELIAGREPDEAALQQRIVAFFGIPCLLECYGVYELVFLAVCMKFRPKTYAGALERLVRRWTSEAAPVGELAVLFLYGGCERIDYLLRVKPYATRRAALTRFVESLTTADASNDETGTSSGKRRASDSGPLSSSKKLVGPLFEPMHLSDTTRVPERWWLISQLPQPSHATIATTVLSPRDLATRRKVFEYLSRLSAGELFHGFETTLLRARRDADRPLLGGWEFAFFAMQAPPRDLPYEKIAEDWTRWYAREGAEDATGTAME